jgi:hypothetical protein
VRTAWVRRSRAYAAAAYRAAYRAAAVQATRTVARRAYQAGVAAGRRSSG